MNKHTVPTHRCPGSLAARISIRFRPRWCFGFGGEIGWWLGRMTYDDESIDPFTPYMETICKIDYCPFCGTKLEVPS